MSGQGSSIKKAMRGFSVSVALRVGRLAINLVLMSLVARYLGQHGFGQLMVAMSIVLVLACVTELGMQTIVTRDLVPDDENQWPTIGSAFFVRVLAGVVCYVGVVGYALLVKPEYWAVLLIYGTILVVSSGTVLTAWLAAKHKVEAVSWIQMAGFLSSAVVMGIGLGIKAPVWFFAFSFVVECVVALALALLVFVKVGGKLRSWKYSAERAKGLLKESWFELASQLALLLLLRIDTIMVEAIRGSAEAGIYGAAVRVSEAVYFVPAILASVCFPPLVALRSRDITRYHQRFTEYFSLTFLIAVPGAVFLALVAPHLISILFGKDFSQSGPILIIHAWGLIPYSIGIARGCYLTAESRLWVNLPSIGLALALNILLNWLWIPVYGGMGAAWATLIAYVIAWVASAFFTRHMRDLGLMIWRGFIQTPALLSHLSELRTWRAELVKTDK